MEPHIWKAEWSDALSIGIPEIDADHKRFILLVDMLNRAIVDRTELQELQKRLQDVMDDAVQHFAHEEQLLREWHYPNAGEHAAKHATIMWALQALKQKFVVYGLPAEWIEAGQELKDLLINHMLSDDMKYAEFYRNTLKARGKP
ncbi:MAG TPA: hemerythrin family protein [Gallionellaceae bacterium]